ncbi:hypothetical protein EE612_022536 [Oryza sativa]|nr:hypothetical protein EE612_022536 [Oryza sativa]
MLRRSKKQKLAKEDEEDARIRDTESPSSVYLVVGHGVTRPSYSLFKVNPHLPANADDGGDTPLPLLPYLAHLTGKHYMSFVSVRSRRHAPWIVGVGGSSARNYGPDETIVFDTVMRKEISGPKLLSTKFCPILLPFGDKIYALARRPAVTAPGSRCSISPWLGWTTMPRTVWWAASGDHCLARHSSPGTSPQLTTSSRRWSPSSPM